MYKTFHTAEHDLLVVGYGNTLRQDDGVGPRTAQRIDELEIPGVAVLQCPQLSPEHVQPISEARVVVFVDAAVDGSPDVQLRPIAPSESAQMTAHSLEPPTILALSRDVYGYAPQAWMLTIPAVQLDFGEDLSPEAARGIDAAVNELISTFLLEKPV